MRKDKDGQERQGRSHRACFKGYKAHIIIARKRNGKKVNRVSARTKAKLGKET